MHRRTTTLVRDCVDGNLSTAGQSFDQEAATAASRLAAYKTQLGDFPDALLWLNHMLMRL
ncbi:hypothetical protein BKA62DRAFT_730808 [Auriculariales sp. MPI-PUGE-AT-0066]|nr:hypothetical protein BKA62DRAFT_730808 [Auriculariales sp. MPI-PUGE-AT-0066]